jgi:hypothetical protein
MPGEQRRLGFVFLSGEEAAVIMRDAGTFFHRERGFVGEVRIQNAARIRFEWFYYGRPKTDQNRYFMDFTRTDHRIDHQNNGTLTLRPMHRDPAVEFVAGMIDGLWDGHWA